VRRAGEADFRRFDEAFGVASPTKFTNVVLRRGDELRYRTPGGAGFGDPADRDPALVREDVLEGYVSVEAAAASYGVDAAAVPA
jgi:N-methylhydantoinase B/oxoprolinase/acetone carboxylase alpha subunit